MFACCKNSIFRSFVLFFTLCLLANNANAGNVSAQANAAFEVFIINAVESGTNNQVDVGIAGNLSSFIPTTNTTSGTGNLSPSIVVTAGGASTTTIPNISVGPTSSIPFASPGGSDPASLAAIYTLEAEATVPGGGTADGSNNIFALADIFLVNFNVMAVDVEYAIVATVSGMALTDGVAGDDAAASASLNVNATGISSINIAGDDLDGCPTMPGDSFCVTQTQITTGVVTIDDFDTAAIDFDGEVAAFAFATDQVAESPTPVNVPMPPLAILLSLISLLSVAWLSLKRIKR